MSEGVTLMALTDLPAIRPGDDLAAMLIAAIERAGLAPVPGDIVVVAQKVVSKAEGRYVDLAIVEPSPRAVELAATTRKDARLVELVLRESSEVLRAKPNVIVVEHRLGHVMANAGIDQSNLEVQAGAEPVLLWPEDPDASAARLKLRLDAHFRTGLGIIVSDSVGRAWRLGTVGLAIGAAGVPALIDRRGEPDLRGRPLEITVVGFADSVAAAAVLVMGEAAEGQPAVLVRGLSWTQGAAPARSLVRSKQEDMFR